VASYWRIRRRKGHNVAVTAVARKLIVVVWHLLTNRELYRYTPPEVARRKLRKATPPELRHRAVRIPRTLEEVYREADLPLPATPSSAERCAAAENRRTRTRIANAFKTT
jgi:hypothetical protein